MTGSLFFLVSGIYRSVYRRVSSRIGTMRLFKSPTLYLGSGIIGMFFISFAKTTLVMNKNKGILDRLIISLPGY